MKKLIALLLTLCLLFSAMPLQAFALGPLDYEDLEYASNDLDETLFNGNFLDKIKLHEGDVQKEYFNQMNLLKQQNAVSFLKGFSTVVNLANGVYTLLMNIGVIENPQEAQFRNILKMLSEVRNIVNEIDKKADSIEKTLSTEFSKIDYEFSQLKYDSYQKAWTDFFTVGAYKDMNDIISAYNSQVNTTLLSYAKSWQTGNENGIRALYNGDLETLVFSGDNMDGVGEEIPSRPRWSDDEDSFRINSTIILPGEYIKIGRVTLNADNYQDFLKKAVTAGVLAAANDGKLEAADSFYSSWNLLPDELKEDKAEEISAQLMDSLHYEVIHEVANSTRSGRGTFASEFKTKYDMFYNTILGLKDVTSPVVAAFNKVKATHAFEGDAFCDFVSYTTLIGTLCVQYGTYATMITALDDSMTSAKKEETERNKKISYNYTLYMLDNTITGYDNYCYPLNALVEFHDAVLVSEAEFTKTGLNTATYKDSIPWTVMDVNDYDITKTAEQKKEAVDKMGSLLSLRDVSLLYYYYQQNGTGKDFLGYLDKNNAVATEIAEDEKHNTTVLTNDYESKNLKVGSSASLTLHTFGYSVENPWRDKMGNEGYTYNELNDCEKWGGKFYVHEQLIGSTFNIGKGSGGATSTSDVAGRSNVNTHLINRVLEYLDLGITYDSNAKFVTHAIETDGKYSKTANINGYNGKSIGTESSGSFKNATYTVSTAKDFGALIIKPLPERNEAGRRTASTFGNGNLALICGSAVLVLAAGFGCGFVISKKKKSKVTEG